MSSSRDADVIVVGAGVAGLGMACALAPHGVRVLLIEPRKSTGGIHRGDSLLPKATRLLARWGVLEAIRAAGARPIDRLEIHHAGRGVLYEGSLTGPDDPHPYLVLPHAEIERVLLARAQSFPATELLRPARATGLLHDRAGVVRGVRYEAAGGSGEALASLVVAADGHRSVFRRAAGIAIDRAPYDHAYLGLEADRPTAYRDAMQVHIHAQGGVLLMPRPERVGLGVLVDAGESARWLKMPDDELAEILAARAPLLRGMHLHRRSAHVYELARAHARQYQLRGLALVGDAAHATNPTAGQGMAMALTDVGLLTDRVLAPLISGEDLTPHLAAYEAIARPANARLVRRSHLLALAYAARGRTWTALKVAAFGQLSSAWARAVTAPVVDAFLEPAMP